MLDAMLKFFRGVFGIIPEENLDKGSFVDEIPKIGSSDIQSREEETGDRGILSFSVGGPQYEDASDLPINNTLAKIGETNLPPEEIVRMNKLTASFQPPFRPISVTQPKYLWCLDNGHGKLQEGKRSPVWSDGVQLEEWRFTRDIVAKISNILDQLGIQYFNVVPEENVGSFLPERVQRANQKVSLLNLEKIFISIHGNAVDGSTSASGLETWYFVNSASGQKIASVFQRHLMFKLNDATNHEWKDRGIRTFKRVGKNFYVLRSTNMPAILTENGFYSNEAECRLMLNDAIQQKIAEAHVAAILEIEKNGFANAPLYTKNTLLD